MNTPRLAAALTGISKWTVTGTSPAGERMATILTRFVTGWS
jgi:hypothetical protein